MNNYFVILAAGKSKRFHKKIAKQFYIYKNKEIIDHSVEKALDSKLFKKLIIVTNNFNYFKKKKYSKNISIIKGGKDRSDSSLKALKYIKKYMINEEVIVIHPYLKNNRVNKFQRLSEAINLVKAIDLNCIFSSSVGLLKINSNFNIRRKLQYLQIFYLLIFFILILFLIM